MARGSFPGLRAGTKPSPIFCAIAEPKMKPRDSRPSTWVGCMAATGSTIRSTAVAKAAESLSRGLMSLKLIPGFGKSGTSRT